MDQHRHPLRWDVLWQEEPSRVCNRLTNRWFPPLTSLSVTNSLARLIATSEPLACNVSFPRLGVVAMLPRSVTVCLWAVLSNRVSKPTRDGGRHPSSSADEMPFTTGNSLAYTFRSQLRACGVLEGPPTRAGVRRPRFTFRFAGDDLRWHSRTRDYTARVHGPFSFVTTMGNFSAADAFISLPLFETPSRGASKLESVTFDEKWV